MISNSARIQFHSQRGTAGTGSASRFQGSPANPGRFLVGQSPERCVYIRRLGCGFASLIPVELKLQRIFGIDI